MTYLSRVVDPELKALLRTAGAVVIEGPKACGKTETARQQAASEVRLDVDQGARAAIAVDPSLILEGARPRLLDEWQIAPELWNHVRRAVDDGATPGAFILTGSASPVDDHTRHTGAGRFARVRMRPMTLFELGVGSAHVSLGGLLDGDATRSPDTGLTLDDLIDATIRGGWPALRSLDLGAAARSVREYLDQVRRTDLPSVDGVARDPERVLRLLQSVARHTATQASLRTLSADVGATTPISDDSIGDYLVALTRLMVVEDLPAWAPHLRSSHRLRTSPTRHFTDPSLAVAALRASPDTLKADLNTFGLLFESLVVRDLRVHASAADAEVFHYRDSGDLEVDAIVSAADGRWIALEVKLGRGQIDQAATNLLKFADRVDTTKRGRPAALGVVTGMGYGYVRDDGVHVIPIGALAP